MIRDILHHFPKFQARKVAKILHTPFGSYWLPTWLTFEWDFISPRGTHYTLFGMAFKYRKKMIKRAIKSNKKQHKTIIQTQ